MFMQIPWQMRTAGGADVCVALMERKECAHICIGPLSEVSWQHSLMTDDHT